MTFASESESSDVGTRLGAELADFENRIGRYPVPFACLAAVLTGYGAMPALPAWIVLAPHLFGVGLAGTRPRAKLISLGPCGDYFLRFAAGLALY